MSNGVVEHLLDENRMMRSASIVSLATDRLIANHEHVENRVPVGVLHVRISTMFDQMIVNGPMTECSSQCQGIFTVIRMRWGETRFQ